MKVEEAIKAGMLVLLKNRGIDAVRVEEYEEDTRNDGYCDTCWYEYTIVVIKYITSTGVRDEYEYYGEFSELVRELTY